MATECFQYIRYKCQQIARYGNPATKQFSAIYSIMTVVPILFNYDIFFWMVLSHLNVFHDVTLMLQVYNVTSILFVTVIYGNIKTHYVEQTMVANIITTYKDMYG